ncbi:MAG: two-component system NtrC family nitrogen regulation sensor histidine kinase GlnL [Gammaproteobacteria bacterium]|nr:MAG: two-component system NtrC family nitrogen regulation sensor histidine kinase GlnL [Gammaproteobacteria bacterium]TND06420.1 MAG: two-component system, NtrC family, nitrogen regulation sensor histidine kinase GlnL [Gammaproteobacteria bacterium]
MPDKPLIDDDAVRRIIEHLGTAVLVFDRTLTLLFMNPAGEMMLAISARQATGKLCGELLPDAVEFEKTLRRSLVNDHPLTEYQMELPLPGHGPITVDCSVTPFSGPRLSPVLLVEMAQVDRHMRISRDENQLAKQQATRAIVRGIAHEIKNPLGGLRGAAQLLERALPNEALKEYTDVIIREADRLQNLMNRMLGPNTLPQKRLINIHQVLEHVRTLVQAELTKPIEIVRDYDPSIPEVHADLDQIIQAVLNIVRNATQAIEGKGTITLRTRTQRQFTIGHGRHRLAARIDIIDNGTGIPPDMIENIFYPMVTGRADGTGLGLAIAQSLVNQHGGLIECSSTAGETTFTLLLPLETTHDQK